ncbi:MAG: hypothetical protein ABL901_20930 [Hyphomicrobiaceae bacterium]
MNLIFKVLRKRKGLPPPYDSKILLDRVHYGEDWKEGIRKAILKVDIVLAFWSRDAVNGRREQFHYGTYQGMMGRKLCQCRIDNVGYDEIGMPCTFDHIADLSDFSAQEYHPELDGLMQDLRRRRQSRWLSSQLIAMRTVITFQSCRLYSTPA